MEDYNEKLCICGSNLPKYDLTDARGIFCTYVCEKCEDEKKSHYRQDIFTDSNYYADEQIEDDY